MMLRRNPRSVYCDNVYAGLTNTRRTNMAFDPAAHAEWLCPHLRVVKPEGSGPFPVVVQMHGCGGVQPLQDRYARAASAAGVAAVIVDSLAPRGISRLEAHLTVCSGLRLRGAERANDLVAVLQWLESQTWADPRQVAAIGWSHGGWSIMEALAALPKDAAPGDTGVSALKLTALFYPYAGPPARTHRLGWGLARPKVFACIGGRDAVVGQVAPRRALSRLQEDGLDVHILSLPDATHAFDDDEASDPRTRFRSDLAELAMSAYVSALKTVFTADKY